MDNSKNGRVMSNCLWNILQRCTEKEEVKGKEEEVVILRRALYELYGKAVDDSKERSWLAETSKYFERVPTPDEGAPCPLLADVTVYSDMLEPTEADWLLSKMRSFGLFVACRW